ncbi:CHAT domain-containing protein [Streptomyces sp. NPDC127033]|uniref:CHAT domain-containing protein n=1 Tax=Streptomyces sp. NPDC127033 TaxID=3347110 RepID=UPI0036486A4C
MTVLEYEELRVRVRQVGPRRYLVLANGPVSGVAVRAVDGEPGRLSAEFAELIDIELGHAPAGGRDVVTRLRALGRATYGLLFDDGLVECIAEALSRAQSTEDHHRFRGLRLRFDLPTELHGLPVEALASPAHRGEQVLALNYNMSLARSLPGNPLHGRLPGAEDQPAAIHLLVAVASPGGLPAIDAGPELAALRKDLSELVVKTTVREHATRRSVETWLAQHANEPVAVLLIAHGGYDTPRNEGVVYLEAEDGTADRVPATLLSGIMVRAQRLRLVVLNLCSGARNSSAEPFSGLAQALIGRGVPAVVGMRTTVTERAAGVFGPVLMEGLSANKTIDEAVTSARQRISDLPGHTSIEWATPALFLHESYAHGWLFKAREVHDDEDEVLDPLVEGEAALVRLDAPGNMKWTSVLAAARFLRTRQDWEGVLRTVRTGRLSEERSRLISEARLELAWPAIDQLCATLADRLDPDAAERILDGITEPQLPRPVRECLRGEIEETRLTVMYGEARAGQEAEDWPAARRAYAAVLALRPDGYRDARQGARYVDGRLAETDHAWSEAAAAYGECPAVADAPLRAAYARGRAAAGSGDWTPADRELTAAVGLGLTPDEWCGYAAARTAEDRQDWPTAAAAFEHLADFLDSPHRALYAAGRAAAEEADWQTAHRAFGKLADGGGDPGDWLDLAGDSLYEQGLAAEAFLDWASAAACYGALPPDHGERADAGARARYAEGRLAELRQDWAAAAAHYAGPAEDDPAHGSRINGARADRGPADADTTGMGPADTGPAHADPGDANTAAGNPEDGGPADAGPAHGDPVDTGLVHADPAHGGPADEDTADGAPVNTGSAHGDRDRGDPTGSTSADGAPGDADTADTDRTDTDRADADGAGELGRADADSRNPDAGTADTGPANADADADADGRPVRTDADGRPVRTDTGRPGRTRTGAPTGHADAAERFGYASGRIAEAAGNWAAAHGCYAPLPADLLDAAERAKYAAGRAADQRDDWPGVIDGFGRLPDDHAEGEVGRRRRYARAELAARRDDWGSVLALLGDARDEERDGQVGLVRRKARGRLAELEQDWTTAATAYAPVAGADPELALAHGYALARLAERDGDWAGALERYTGLPDGHHDVPVRRGYASARLAELGTAEGPDGWREVVERYAALPDGFADVPARAGYARLRLAVAEQDWHTAAEAAESLSDRGYSDLATLTGYVRGRAAEQRADWPEAVAAYAGCLTHADSRARQAYARGRELEDGGRWRSAVLAYAAAPGPVADLAARQARLESLLAALPWADRAASGQLLADPLAERDPGFPYRALDSAGITPGSPTDTVQNAAFMLMERGGMSWQERVAWNQLRWPAQRLLVDAFLYRLREPAALADRLGALEPAGRPELTARLCADLPDDAPLLTLLSGDRGRATAEWRRRLAAAPGDLATVHSLAVASFWQARELEHTGAWEQAEPVWREVLACWAVLLTDDKLFWAGWRQARAASYGQAVTPANTNRLRVDLGQHLVALLSGHADRHTSAGRSAQAASYQELVSFLERELEGARALSEAGGLPLSEDPQSPRLACGPGYLEMTGLLRRFGRFVARATEQRTGHGEPESESASVTLRRVRWAFSELARASSLVERHRFESALRALPEFHRQRMPELPADCGGPGADGHPGIGECPPCQDFLRRNPAHTYLPRRRNHLQQDAVGLAVRAHLFIARGLLANRGELGRAMAELTEAIGIAANAAMTVRVKEAVLRLILGRVDALTDMSVLQIDPLNESIALVEAALPVVGTVGTHTLTARWAALLVDRGIWYSSRCRDVGVQPDLPLGLADLRRALELNPASARPRLNLAQALIFEMDALPGGNTTGGRLTILREALVILHHGLIRAEADSRLLECQLGALEELEPLLLAGVGIDQLNDMITEYGTNTPAESDPSAHADDLLRQAEEKRLLGDRPGFLHRLVRACRTDPTSVRVRQALLDALDADLGPRATESEPESEPEVEGESEGHGVDVGVGEGDLDR